MNNTHKKKITGLISTITIGLLLASQVFGATIFVDDFNSYTDGVLDGQGNWIGDISFEVQDDISYEGKAIRNSALSEQVITKTGTPLTDGKITFYVRTTELSASKTFQIYLDDGTESYPIRVQLHYSAGSKISYLGETAFVEIQTISPDTWYSVEIEWRSSDYMTRYRVNEETWTDWVNVSSTWTSINKFSVWHYGEAGFVSYFDYVAENLYEEPEPPPLFAWIDVDGSMTADMMAMAGDFFVGLAPVVSLAVGVPMAFVVIKKVIGLIV